MTKLSCKLSLFFVFVFKLSFGQAPPNAQDDYDTAEINTTLSVPAPGVLINDTDPNGDPLSVESFFVNGVFYTIGDTANFAQGSITILADGSFTFVPTAGYTGDNVPAITYTISDGTLTDTANLFLTVEEITDLIQFNSLSSCNQGFGTDGNYNIQYSLSFTNTSTARDYHANNLIENIDITQDLDAIYGAGCVVEISNVNVSTTETEDYIGAPYPQDFDVGSINPNFLNNTSNNLFTNTSIADAILYPRQRVNISFCVTVSPFCDGRPNPTPSGSGIDFNAVFDVSSSIGNDTVSLNLTDFHTTEAILTAGLFIPNQNPEVNPDGTYDYVNTVIISNEGTSTANNINFNMGLGRFFNNGLTFNTLTVSQVSGPAVTVNTAYNGNADTALLAPNNTLAPGATIILEIFHLLAPVSSSSNNNFNQFNLSQTQGGLDGFDEDTPAIRRITSFVTWDDNLGNHLDRYYITNSATDTPTNNQCACAGASMSFSFTSSSSATKTIINTNEAPNGILEHQELTFQFTITNTSPIVELDNLQLQENFSGICGSNNIVSSTAPTIVASTATTNPVLNPDFNGTTDINITDINIFNGSSGLLMAGESITLELTLVLNEDCLGSNTINFFATDPLGNSANSSASVDVNASTDSDNDEITNINDIDDDNDTILDIEETNGRDPLGDHDNDLRPNYRDLEFGLDANNDGIVDLFDFDGDGIANHLDLDVDNDGILDIVEVGNAALDNNNDGLTDNPVGVNGLDNTVETDDTSSAAVLYTIINTDMDTNNPNYADIDSDNDGIVDNIEAQPTDNYTPPSTTVTNTGIDTAYPNGLNPIDTDGDTSFDYVDTNSDNDIRNDNIEGWDFNNDGTPETLASDTDNDNDGLDDAYDNNDTAVNPTNGQLPTDMYFPNVDYDVTPELDWREIMAVVVIIDDASATEGGDLTFTIRLVTFNDNTILTQSNTPIEITLFTTDGTTTTNLYDVAIAPFDYTSIVNVPITIPSSTETFTVTVSSLDDIIFELNELFTLNGRITTTNTINTEAAGIGTIFDNESAPDITMNHSRENEGVDLVHTIEISHPCSTPIDINISTINNTAIAPLDYTSIRSTFTINGTVDLANANTETSFNITTLLDNLNEPDEEFLNVLGNVTTGNVGNQDLTKTGTIIDIDPDPLVVITDDTVVEGKALEFEISLRNTSGELMRNYLPINFNLQTSDITTTASQDYPLLISTGSIPALETTYTQNISTIDDRLNEDTETMNLIAILTSAGVSNPFSTIAGLGTIKDNDIPNLFSPNGNGLSEEFRIDGIEDFPNFKIVIIDRWGSEVYNYSNNGALAPLWWDGTYNGKPVVEGVYFYTLDFNDGITPPKTGFIQLVR